MKLAFSLMLKDDSHAQGLLEAIRAAGFDGVEPTFGLEGSLPNFADYANTAERCRQTSAGLSLSISSMRGGPGFWATFASDDASKRRAAVELAEKAFAALKIMGGDTLLIVPGQWEAHQKYSDVWKNAIETAQRIGELAERAGINVGFENVENKFLLSPREWMQFLDEVNHPRVKMYFDVGNVLYLRQGHPEQWIKELGRKYITRIHFKDSLIGGPIHYLLEGAVNWPAVTSAMREIGYDDWVGVELNLPAHHVDAMLTSQCCAARGILGEGIRVLDHPISGFHFVPQTPASGSGLGAAPENLRSANSRPAAAPLESSGEMPKPREEGKTLHKATASDASRGGAR